MLDDATGSVRRPVSSYRCCTAPNTPLVKTPNQKRSTTYLFTSAPASAIFVGPIEGVALDLHLRGSVRQKVDLVTYHIVVASLHLRESVRSNRATLIGYWAGRQQAVKKTGSI